VEGRLGLLLHITPERPSSAERAFNRWGVVALVFGRHIIGRRVPLTVTAGILRIPYEVFASSVAVSSVVWPRSCSSWVPDSAIAWLSSATSTVGCTLSSQPHSGWRSSPGPRSSMARGAHRPIVSLRNCGRRLLPKGGGPYAGRRRSSGAFRHPPGSDPSPATPPPARSGARGESSPSPVARPACRPASDASGVA